MEHVIVHFLLGHVYVQVDVSAIVSLPTIVGISLVTFSLSLVVYLPVCSVSPSSSSMTSSSLLSLSSLSISIGSGMSYFGVSLPQLCHCHKHSLHHPHYQFQPQLLVRVLPQVLVMLVLL